MKDVFKKMGDLSASALITHCLSHFWFLWKNTNKTVLGCILYSTPCILDYLPCWAVIIIFYQYMNTAFCKLDLFSFSCERMSRFLFGWAQHELFSITGPAPDSSSFYQSVCWLDYILDAQGILGQLQAEGRNLFILQSIQNSAGAHPTCSSDKTEGCFPMVKS